MQALGVKPPPAMSVKHTFSFGKTRLFDPERAAEYLSSFAIKRA
jgi:hypothetical protein